jgi:hypothetical protein
MQHFIVSLLVLAVSLSGCTKPKNAPTYDGENLPPDAAGNTSPTASGPELRISKAEGGTIMNILRHELPDTDRSSDVLAFATAAAVYGALLLSLSPAG